MQQSKYSFDEVSAAVTKHLTDRGWHQGNALRGVALSLSLEANELLEHYQGRQEPATSIEELTDELADVMIYAIQFANWYNVDLSDAVMKKLEKIGQKYPVEMLNTDTPQSSEKLGLA